MAAGAAVRSGQAQRAEIELRCAEEILDGRVKDGFVYPVAIYDHDVGAGDNQWLRASRAGLPRLRGMYGFGDIHAVRIFVADLAALNEGRRWHSPHQWRPSRKCSWYAADRPGSANGRKSSLHELTAIATGMVERGTRYRPRGAVLCRRARPGGHFLTRKLM